MPMSAEAKLWLELADVQSALAQVTKDTPDEDYVRLMERYTEITGKIAQCQKDKRK